VSWGNGFKAQTLVNASIEETVSTAMQEHWAFKGQKKPAKHQREFTLACSTVAQTIRPHLFPPNTATCGNFTPDNGTSFHLLRFQVLKGEKFHTILQFCNLK
jgi:hypothetical protein